MNTPPPFRTPLEWLVLLYCAASLAHFAHNAEFLADYPNLLHYGRAPFAEHTGAMNSSILLEVVTAGLLLACTALLGAKQVVERTRAPG